MIKSTLFLGIRLDKNLKHAAYTSATWKLATIAWQSQKGGPKLIPHDGAEYYGFAVSTNYTAILESSKLLASELLKHLPNLDEKDLKVYIFPLTTLH